MINKETAPFLALAGTLGAQNTGPTEDRWSGIYKSQGEQIELRRQGAGYAGTLSANGISLALTAHLQGTSLEGTIAVGPTNVAFKASLVGSRMSIVMDDASYTLEKQETPAPAKPGATSRVSGIVGEWRSSTGTIRFGADGTVVNNGSSGRYAIQGNILILSAPDGSVQIPFALSGDTLTLTVNGQTIQLTRNLPGSQPVASGSHPPELAGKWCYQSNVYANNGGASNSSSCFILKPDGTYEYHGLADSYNPNGGVTSQTDDSGTWTATETSITAKSRLRGTSNTYRLEKRNHPKTGDPMLVLDGQAFVTFYQKAPWR